MRLEQCTEIRTDKIIKLKENKSALLIKNEHQKEIHITKVDGCMVKENQKKCDWLAICEDSAHLIELKGSDLDKAIQQLEETIRLLKGLLRGKNISCYAVTTKVPKFGSKCAIIKRNFYKRNGTLLHIKNTIIEVCI